MQLFRSVILLATLAAATVIPRDFASVETDLSKLYNATDNVTALANADDDTPLKNFFLYRAQQLLGSNFSAATTDLTNGPVLDPTEANLVFRNISVTLVPKLRAAFNAVIARKPNITHAGLNSPEVSLLSSLSTSITLFGSALRTRVPPQSTVAASAVSQYLSSLAASANSAYAAAPSN